MADRAAARAGIQPGEWLALAGFAGVTALVAWLGNLATSGAVESRWFEDLAKPSFYPPNAVFGIVWTVLYALIALAGWLAWRAGGTRPLVLYLVQLALNLGWSVVFFGLRSPGWALLEIALLLMAAGATLVVFFRVDRWAGWLFAPYVAWIVFAMVLNASIVTLNLI